MAVFAKKDKIQEAVEVLSSQEYENYQQAIDSVGNYLEETGLSSVGYNLDFIVSEAFETDGSTYLITVDLDELEEIIETGRHEAYL